MDCLTAATMGQQRYLRVRAYRRDTIVQRLRPNNLLSKRKVHTVRGYVSSMSKASAKRLVFTARNAVGLRVIFTLTYGAEFPTDGRQAKKHLQAMHKRIERRFGPTGMLWFFEFQQRGAPHFHCLVDRRIPKRWLAAAWAEVVGQDIEASGTQIDWIRKPHSMGAYVAKYAAKQQQKECPAAFSNPGRYWGVRGDLDRGEVWEGECEQGGALEPVVRVLRRLKHWEGSGRNGYTYNNVGRVVVQALIFYDCWRLANGC